MKIVKKLAEEAFKGGFEIGFKKAKEMVLEELDKEHLDYDRDGGLTDCPALLFWTIENLGEEDENV